MINHEQNNALQQVYIFGPGRSGKVACERWNMYDDDGYQLVGFISTRRPAGDICMGLPVVRPEEVDQNAVVIFCVSREDVPGLYERLWKHGVRKFFRYRDSAIPTGETNFLSNECVRVDTCDKGTLGYVEMHVTDHCNLNCKGCTHYSPIFADNFPNLDKRLADIARLKEKVTNILVLRLMGGEPLLHPELPAFVGKVRELLPETDLRIVTNGLLIPTASDDLFEALRKNDIAVDVSEYAPTKKIRGQIEKKLSHHKIKYSIAAWDIKQAFLKPLSLSPSSKYEHFCFSNGCINLWEGKIARCPSVMYLERFNEKFGTELPGDGVYDLDTCPSGKELIQLLNQSIPLCRHCVDNRVSWEQCGRNITVEDFAVHD